MNSATSIAANSAFNQPNLIQFNSVTATEFNFINLLFVDWINAELKKAAIVYLIYSYLLFASATFILFFA